MDILSFVLGIAVVVIIGVSVIAVIAFVKARKIEEETNRIHTIMGNEAERVSRDIDKTHVYIGTEISAIHRRIDDFEKEVFSQLDSRLDKLENKLTTTKK